jgi:trigger factor
MAGTTGETVKVEVKQVAELVREVAVEIPAEQVTTAIDKKYDEVRRSVTIKGFRKGKAPLDMVKKMYSEDIKMEIAEHLIETTYPQAIRDNDLKVASRPLVTDVAYDDHGAFRYTAKVEVFPVIGKVLYDGLKIESTDTAVTDAEVADYSNSIRERFADIREVTRPVQAGDLVKVHLVKTHDPGNALKQTEIPEADVDLSSHLTIKEFREELPGMKIGDTKEIKVTYASDYSDPAFAGKEIHYNCTVNGVREKILPEFNDGFAKMTRQAETALELRLKIRQEIERQKKEEERQRQKSQLMHQMCEKNPVPIPEGLVQDYMAAMLEDIRKQDPNSKIDEVEFKTAYKDMAINALRWDMLTDKLAEQETIEVSQQDTENVIKRFAEAYKVTPEEASQALTKSGRASSIRTSILERKVVDFLFEKAGIKNN